MKTNQYILLFVFIVPVIFAGTLNTFANEMANVKLTSQFKVSYCGGASPRTEVLVTIGLGEVKKTDSLYGFNFAINYDRSKLYFNSKITMNTLSEFADYADLSFGLEPGKMFGAALNNTPLTGNKELMGFYGEYIGELCEDSALIEIDYIEFTDEFQKSVNKLDTIWIVPEKVNVDYSINTNFNSDYYNYDTNSTNLLPVQINLINVKSLDYLGYKIQAENNAYKVNIVNVNDNFDIVSNVVNNSDNEIVLKYNSNIKLDNIIKLFDIEIIKIGNDTDTLSKIIVNPIKLSNCYCYDSTKVTADNILIKYIKNTTTSVEDNIDNFSLVYQNAIFSVKSSLENINRIQLFNSVGNTIIDEFVNDIYYNHNINIPTGVYFALIWTDKQLIKKKILVNY